MKNSKHRNQIAHKKQDSLDHIWNHIPYGSIKIPKTDRIKTKKSILHNLSSYLTRLNSQERTPF